MDNNKASNTRVTSKKSHFQTHVMFGIRGGITILNLDFEDAPFMENKHRNRMYLVVFADISLSNTISLVPELQFSGEGAKDEKFIQIISKHLYS